MAAEHQESSIKKHTRNRKNQDTLISSATHRQWEPVYEHFKIFNSDSLLRACGILLV